MEFFIGNAWAQTGGAPAASGGFASLIPLVLIFVIFYFLLLRPQMKRAKELKKMVSALAKGDEVVTTGGLLGRVTKVDENFAAVEIADGVVVKLQKAAITAMLPKGTLGGTLGKEKAD
jgi:preprotein translocase subunit YajC